MVVVGRKALEVVAGVRAEDTGLVAGNVDVTSHLDGREGRRDSEGEATVRIEHCIERVPAWNGLAGHDGLATTGKTGANFNHARVIPLLLLLVPLRFDFAMAKAILNSHRSTDAFGIAYHGSELGVVRVHHRLPPVHHCAVSIDLVVLPNVSDLNTTVSGGACNKIHSELGTAKELLKKGEVGLGAVGTHRFDNLGRPRNGFLHAVADVDIAGTHTTGSLDDDGEIELEFLDGLADIASITGRKSGVLGDTKTGVGNGLLHQSLVTTGRSGTEVIVDGKTKQGSKQIRMVNHGLAKGKDAQEPKVLLRLDGVKMVGALGDAEVLASGRLIDLVDTKLEQLLGSGVVHDVLAAIDDLGVDDGDKESTLGGTFEKDEALGHTRLEKDDGVLELMVYMK